MIIAANIHHYFFGYKKIALFFLVVEMSLCIFESHRTANKSTKIIDDISPEHYFCTKGKRNVETKTREEREN